jgi:hypothetical protein
MAVFQVNLAGVNCVAWNFKKNIFASSADDHQVRIWAPNLQRQNKEKID